MQSWAVEAVGNVRYEGPAFMERIGVTGSPVTTSFINQSADFTDESSSCLIRLSVSASLCETCGCPPHPSVSLAKKRLLKREKISERSNNAPLPTPAGFFISGGEQVGGGESVRKSSAQTHFRARRAVFPACRV
jgi:hypothetical protein